MTRVVDLVRAVIAPLTRTACFRRFAPAALPPVERFVSALSGRRVQLSALLVPSLILHTRGAKSGEPRDAPLMYTPDGAGRAIVAGTNFAGSRHPAWTTNLLATPDAEITVRGRRMAVHADADPRRRAGCRVGAHRGAVAGLPQVRARLRAYGPPLPPAARSQGRAESGREARDRARPHDQPQRQHADRPRTRP